MRVKIKVKSVAKRRRESVHLVAVTQNVLLAKSTAKQLINLRRVRKVRITKIILLACVALILQQQQQHHKAQAARRAPSASSSSSLFADVEDLADSSVRTRLGTLTIEHLGSEPADFDRLIERLVRDGDSQQPQPQQAQTFQEIFSAAGALTQPLNSRTPADANNRTTMRFFRNSKTFASIVYTNSEMETNKQRIPRRLINCHLVDLEKHSSDVAIYEAKYDIRTLDVDFKQMMQLIEACTNIARLRRRPVNSIGQQPSAPGSQYKSTASSSQQSSHWPVTVLGRPAPASASQVSSSAQPSLQASPPPPTQVEFVEMHNHKDGINPSQRPSRQQQHQHHHRKSGEQANQSSRARRRYDPYPPPAFYANHSQAQNSPLRRQLVKTLAQVHEQGKKLVLGEVTAPPTLSNKRAGSSTASSTGLRDALQEISSYDTSDLLSIWRGILPGTNWCGMGDRATSYNDLGFESDIDICCRAHDFCPVRLSAFTSGYGLFNWSFYTRSHCWCDQNFLDCLQQAESPLSAVVMKFYFSIMKTTCLNDISSSGESPGKPEVATSARKQQFPPKIGALKQSQWMATKYEQRPAALRHHAGAPEHKARV